MPVLSSPSLRGPGGSLARGSGHQRCPVLEEPLSYGLCIGSLHRQVTHTGVKREREAGCGSQRGHPRGGSDGYVLPRGQRPTSLAGVCPEGAGRKSACWRPDCEAAEMLLCSLLFLKHRENNPPTWANGASPGKAPNPTPPPLSG